MQKDELISLLFEYNAFNALIIKDGKKWRQMEK